MPMPTPLIPPPEYQEEIKRRFTVNSSQPAQAASAAAQGAN